VAGTWEMTCNCRWRHGLVDFKAVQCISGDDDADIPLLKQWDGGDGD